MKFWRLDILQDPVAYPTGCMVLEPATQPPAPRELVEGWALGVKAWHRLPDGGFIIAADDYSDALWLAADCVSTYIGNQRRRVRHG